MFACCVAVEVAPCGVAVTVTRGVPVPAVFGTEGALVLVGAAVGIEMVGTAVRVGTGDAVRLRKGSMISKIKSTAAMTPAMISNVLWFLSTMIVLLISGSWAAGLVGVFPLKR